MNNPKCPKCGGAGTYIIGVKNGIYQMAECHCEWRPEPNDVVLAVHEEIITEWDHDEKQYTITIKQFEYCGVFDKKVFPANDGLTSILKHLDETLNSGIDEFQELLKERNLDE